MNLGGDPNAQAFAKKLFGYFTTCLQVKPSDVNQIGVSIAIPTFTADECEQLCDYVKPYLLNQPAIMELTTPIYVVGDLHGNIYDLIRILVLADLPPRTKFLFLGDYVDRGPYSVEVVMLLFCLVILFPSNIYLIRGNHEFRNINDMYGFKSQVLDIYGIEPLWERFNKVFDCLPFAAIINGTYFCVHGGISSALRDLTQISSVKRPINFCDSQVLKDILWSDPNESTMWFEESARGDGALFGHLAIDDFLKRFNFTKLLRAHQCVKLGIERLFGDKGLTIFSSSAYDADVDNRCGLVFIANDGNIQTFSLPPITPIPRENAYLEKGSLLKHMKVMSTSKLPACQIVRSIPSTLHSNTRRKAKSTILFHPVQGSKSMFSLSSVSGIDGKGISKTKSDAGLNELDQK